MAVPDAENPGVILWIIGTFDLREAEVPSSTLSDGVDLVDDGKACCEESMFHGLKQAQVGHRHPSGSRVWGLDLRNFIPRDGVCTTVKDEITGAFGLLIIHRIDVLIDECGALGG